MLVALVDLYSRQFKISMVTYPNINYRSSRLSAINKSNIFLFLAHLKVMNGPLLVSFVSTACFFSLTSFGLHPSHFVWDQSIEQATRIYFSLKGIMAMHLRVIY